MTFALEETGLSFSYFLVFPVKVKFLLCFVVSYIDKITPEHTFSSFHIFLQKLHSRHVNLKASHQRALEFQFFFYIMGNLETL